MAKAASKKTPSARKPTAKAKAAKDAASEEEIQAPKKQKLTLKVPAKNKAARKKKELELSDSGDEGQAGGENLDDDAGDDADDKVDWKDIDLNWNLITVLEEDQTIRQGLFPVPGANISVAQGGSKPKTDYQWMLAQRLFENHEKYKDVFASVQTPADKANWQRKIKNRLKRMTQDIRKYRDMMGETGAGIIHEDDINTERNNSLTQSWAAIKEKCPWFFKLKAIIDERPSAVPVGVGNNSSEYDVSILVPSMYTSEFDSSDLGLGLDITDGDVKGGDGEVNSSDEEADSDGEVCKDGSDDEGGHSRLKMPNAMKRKATAVEAPDIKTPKTSARAGKSTPAAATASQRAPKKPKTGIEKMNAIAAKEEETTQKVLDLKRLKVKGENDKVLAKIKAKAELKMQQMKLRAELEQKKMDNEFQLQMARLTQSRLGHAYTEAGSGSMVHNNTALGSGYSNAGSVTPSTYSNEQLQLDPSLEFFGQNSSYSFNQHLKD